MTTSAPTPDESAERVLEGVLGQKKMTFSEFRSAMYDEHPEFLTDDQIHDLYMRHVVQDQTVKLSPVEEDAVEDFLERAIPNQTLREVFDEIGPVRIVGRPADDQQAQILQRLGFEPGRKPEQMLGQPGTGPGSAAFRQQRPGTPKSALVPRKPIGDYTIAEAVEGVAKRVRGAFSTFRRSRDA